MVSIPVKFLPSIKGGATIDTEPTSSSIFLLVCFHFHSTEKKQEPTIRFRAVFILLNSTFASPQIT